MVGDSAGCVSAFLTSAGMAEGDVRNFVSGSMDDVLAPKLVRRPLRPFWRPF